ncbi:hypothetical protein [Pontibacillus yanchengensis]|uniref:Uncharacterized protein n=1 Tax=Pontibacillus yanchengensis Y32 TaxID=1385514 RepID=A0A0A2TJS5_9BACI|nr:hypothetical protein [Pontibacillus yanchengensis]KGP74693.1 hypothetical protein N782_00590 [Pontibacillus yanchengensis Y32]
MKRRNIQQKVDQELEHVTFQSQSQVLERVKPASKKERLRAWLNKEVEVPLVPAATASLLLVVSLTFKPFFLSNNQEHPAIQENDELIERGGSVYWKSSYMEVKNHARENEN